MSSRVLSGSKLQRVEPVHWLTAFGQPVNAGPPTPEYAHGDPAPPDLLSKEMDGALQRIQVLERRIHELEAELPRRHEQGRQEGRAEGERLGTDTATARLQPLFDRLAATIGDLASYRARFRRDSEPELLKLSLAVARKILRRELTVDPHSLLGVLKAALETVNQSEVLCVRTSPEDANQLSGRLAGLGLPDQIELIPDRTLERGSVVLDTKRGQVDASINTQLAEIETGFADRIAASRQR